MQQIIDTFEEKALHVININYGDRKRSDQNKVLTNYQIANKLIEYMKKELLNKQEDIIIDKGKIVFTDDNWRNLSKNKYFKENPIFASSFTQKLKKAKVLSVKSKKYPSLIKMYTPNPLAKEFLFTNLSNNDVVLRQKERIIEDLNTEGLGEKKIIAIYSYMRLVSLENHKKSHFKYFSKANFYRYENMIFWVYFEENDSEFTNIHTYMLDEVLSKAVIDIFYNSFNNLLGYVDHIFEMQNLKEYERRMRCYQENISINEFRREIRLQYQLNSSALKLTLKIHQGHPKITLQELNKLIPNLIPNNLIEIEKKNFKYWKKNFQSNEDYVDDEEKIEDVFVAEQLQIDDSIYKQMSLIKNIPEKDSELKKYISKWNNFLMKQICKDTYLKPLYKYFLLLIEKIDKKSKNRVKVGTLKSYISIFINYVFKQALYAECINADFVKDIELFITKAQIQDSTKRAYLRIFKHFLYSCTIYDSKAKVDSIIAINKSILFIEELDQVIENLKNNHNNIGKDIKIKQDMQSVFVLLLYYTGLRKTELRSRLLSDIIYLKETDEFIIDVNAQSLRQMLKSTKEKINKGLKTNNSKRRVRFKIESQRHNEVVKKYFYNLQRKDTLFLFPRFSNDSKVYKKQAMKGVFFEELNGILQNITSRYVTLHSLRHSYATKEVLKIMNKEVECNYPMQELANKLGHSDISMTLKIYAHLEIVFFRYDLLKKV